MDLANAAFTHSNSMDKALKQRPVEVVPWRMAKTAAALRSV
jgi:hypothetical protein